MFELPHDEQTAANYFDELQWNIGKNVAFAIIPTAYLISKDQMIGQASAFVIFFVAILFAIAKGDKYRQVVKRFLELPRYRCFEGKVVLFFKTAIFSLSVSIMYLLAIGELDIEILKVFFSWFNLN